MKGWQKESGNNQQRDYQKRDRDEQEDYFNEQSEQRPVGAIGFARSSNILTSKYGLPISASAKNANMEEDDDPFDAYMKEIEQKAQIERQTAEQQASQMKNTGQSKKTAVIEANQKGEVLNFNEEENQSYGKFQNQKVQPKKNEVYQSKTKRGDELNEDQDDEEYVFDPNSVGNDEDEAYDKMERLMNDNGEIDYNKLRQMEKKGIQPLQAVDHTVIEYDGFQKDFYKEHPTISAMTFDQINFIRREMGIRVEGEKVPRPIQQFDQLIIDNWILQQIHKMNYKSPTPIQCQALPCALQGRDVIGIAKTGSGKTIAFVIPMITHILDQRELERGEGPIGLVLAPTRELANQIYEVYRTYCKRFNINVLPIFGGINQHQLWKDIKAGKNEIVVATPGRLMDMIKKKAFTLTSRCTFLVIDEADQMFNMGFEYQVRSIAGQIRPDRQTLFFSATFKHKIEELSRDILIDPIKIVIGKENVSNEDVSQTVLIFKNDSEKLQWLIQTLEQFLVKGGQVLIFANQIQTVEQLHTDLLVFYRSKGISCLHGDKSQIDRTNIINKVKSKEVNILISTNVASRGLDIPSIKTVINYDCAKDKEDHIHRVGRTGRAGDKEGVAYTLITKGEAHKAGMLVKILEQSNQIVSQELEELALHDSNFRKGRTTIGIKNFNMKVNLVKEQNKMKNLRKIGDRTGIGFSGPSDSAPSKSKQQSKFDVAMHEEMINQKIAREAQMLFRTREELGGGDLLDKLDEYSDRFKNTMKNQFQSSFVSSGTVQSAKTEPTITFIKKVEAGEKKENDEEENNTREKQQIVKEVITLDEYESRPKVQQQADGVNYVNRRSMNIEELTTRNRESRNNNQGRSRDRSRSQDRRHSRKHHKRSRSRSSRNKHKSHHKHKHHHHNSGRHRRRSSSSRSSSSYSRSSSSSRSNDRHNRKDSHYNRQNTDQNRQQNRDQRQKVSKWDMKPEDK